VLPLLLRGCWWQLLLVMPEWHVLHRRRGGLLLVLRRGLWQSLLLMLPMLLTIRLQLGLKLLRWVYRLSDLKARKKPPAATTHSTQRRQTMDTVHRAKSLGGSVHAGLSVVGQKAGDGRC
jgi:hypothetical protein